MKKIKSYFNVFSFCFRTKGMFESKKRKFKNKGISLIETMVTIMILAFAITGAIYLMITIVNSTAKNKTRITAIYLAQECTELSRNLRDSAWKQNLSWDCAFPDKTKSYRISPNVENKPPLTVIAQTDCQKELGALVEPNDGLDDFFILKKTNGGFSHESLPNAQKTNFQRKISIKDADSEKMTITCEVSWKNKVSTEKVEISEILTNWKNY